MDKSMATYHVWFATKGRKWLLQGEVAGAAKSVFHEGAREKSICLLECEAIVDHVHLLLELQSEAELPKVMNALKGISARRLFMIFPDLKHDARTDHFWQTGYGAKAVSVGAATATRHYIRTQWDRLAKYDR